MPHPQGQGGAAAMQTQAPQAQQAQEMMGSGPSAEEMLSQAVGGLAQEAGPERAAMMLEQIAQQLRQSAQQVAAQQQQGMAPAGPR